MFRVIIDNKSNGLSISQYLDNLGVSVVKKKQLNSYNSYYVNRVLSDQNQILKENDLLEIDVSKFETKKYRPVDFNLTILYEDEYLIVIDKPSGYIIYDVDDVKNSICNFLRNYYKIYKKQCDIIPIHRLDNDTSGCLMFAKDVLSGAFLSRLFENNEVIKKYVAKVSGVLNKEGVIEKNIGKDRHINNKMIIFERGKTAITKYKLLDTNNKLSLVEAMPITGRTHQVRVHLASIGNPLVGDTMYGSKIKNDRIMLHCQSMTFVHPIKNKKVMVYSPLPQEFQL